MIVNIRWPSDDSGSSQYPVSGAVKSMNAQEAVRGSSIFYRHTMVPQSLCPVIFTTNSLRLAVVMYSTGIPHGFTP